MTLYFVGGYDTVAKTLAVQNFFDGDHLFVASSGNLVTSGADAAVNINGSFTQITVRGAIYSDRNAIENTTAQGASEPTAFSGTRITVDTGGLIGADFHAINIAGIGTTITNAGTISGLDTVFLNGDNATVHNTGLLTGTSETLYVTGDGARIVNSGDLIGDMPIIVLGDDANLSNSGAISGRNSGVSIVGNDAVLRNSGSIEVSLASSQGVNIAGANAVVENSGRIASTFSAVTMGSGTLLNTGSIVSEDADAVRTGGDVEMVNGGTITGLGGAGVVGRTSFLGSGNSFGLHNTGTIAGEGFAIRMELQSANQFLAATIVNDGTIDGNVQFSNGNDLYDGRGGKLTGFLLADAGNDTLLGGTGDETLVGGEGSDEIKGGGGDDAVHGGAGPDFMQGGEGTDLLMYNLSTAAVAVNLEIGRARGGDAQGDRFGGFENLWGSNQADRLVGSSGDNQLAGLGGNDTIDGGAGRDEILGVDGDDVLRGGDGDDLIEGGQGRDVMQGDAGFDTFRFRDLADSTFAAAGRDLIQGFVQGEDLFDLSLIDPSAAAGDQVFAFRGAAVFTGTAPEVRFQQANGNTVVTANVNGDKAADFAFLVQGLFTLTADDFVL